MDEYRPQMSRNRVDHLRRWHEDASESLHAIGAHDVGYLGLDLHIPAQVFPPTPTSDLLGSQVRSRVHAGDRVLDMGCGAGANAILAAQITGEVVAVDVNPLAVDATTANAERNGVGDRVHASCSDVFDEVSGEFDVIVFDPPFRWFSPHNPLERALTDEKYRSLGRFMNEVSSRLRLGGEVLLFFGTSGDVEHLDHLIDRAELNSEVVAERTLPARGEDTTYFVRSLTAGNAPRSAVP
ncbi:MAG: methyltransferase [Actinomycetia bacterium]|nr:methyltransferase [Actinomycetes bacterium]